MRVLTFTAIAAICCAFAFPSDRLSEEETIRGLEAEEVAALLSADTKKLEALWDDSMVVNSPLDLIAKKKDVLARVSDGRIAYASFERRIEAIVIQGGIAVVMGSETGVPSPTHVLRPGRMNRRFTNIWAKREGAWRQIARHSNLICDRSGAAQSARPSRPGDESSLAR
ncbi:MAG: nuclear transport factor 2 family protein [Acidobacteriota bacterium]|nr:MAG: nuclear transport factor 2 family protein [Acidobacteriota bacterium]